MDSESDDNSSNSSPYFPSNVKVVFENLDELSKNLIKIHHLIAYNWELYAKMKNIIDKQNKPFKKRVSRYSYSIDTNSTDMLQ